jgi:hypothetical protein
MLQSNLEKLKIGDIIYNPYTNSQYFIVSKEGKDNIELLEVFFNKIKIREDNCNLLHYTQIVNPFINRSVGQDLLFKLLDMKERVDGKWKGKNKNE